MEKGKEGQGRRLRGGPRHAQAAHHAAASLHISIGQRQSNMRTRRGGNRGSAGRLGVVVLPILVLVGVVLAGSSPPQHPTTPIYDVALDLNDTHHLYWRLDYGKKEVEFEVHTRGRGRRPWLAVGFSDRGLLEGADLCVLWTDWHGRVHFQNAFVGQNLRLILAESQACDDFRYKVREDVIKFTFSRKFDTCRPHHYVIQRGTTHVVWSWGTGPLYRLSGVLAAGDQTGLVRVELLKPSLPLAPEDDEAQVLEVRSQKVKVPAEETVYWCTVERLPDVFAEKRHVLQFGPAIEAGNEDLVHHMELFHCEYPPDVTVPKYQGLCASPDRDPKIDACKRVLAAWAMGASAFVYPQEAGLPVGGPDFNPYVMLEVHYNNPRKLSGRVDSSGLALHHTRRLRQHDAAIMELGLEYIDKMAIPPHIQAFTLSGYCVPECTALGLPADGIHIFGSQLHTHLTGVRAWTKHLREGTELADLNRDNHYSTHFQEIRRLPRPVHVMPGDALIMSCEYSTSEREKVTVGGFAISDEMCVNYVHYYPKTDLEVCKSSVDSATLVNYFGFMKRWELQNTSQEATWRENYEAIKWTPLRSGMLADLYLNSPVSMQCNKSSGVRFPGYWENIPIPRILHPLPPPQSPCSPAKEVQEGDGALVN
ncbi:dopamine beta-hydroxylase-like [Eriocheir sinensis]|uniref:dopamine beta-hydroxylase-like n=1 Tax=Eriocheir sinensis TaxID=95602 RepID=UPI0021C80A8B|nr:dopamine beta-hydroxylase-like [Eriocheir sinensis]